MNYFRTTCLFLGLFFLSSAHAQRAEYIKDNYYKKEAYIPMRDGAKLYTAIYTPKDSSVKYPILMVKTPYSNQPYGIENFHEQIGPSAFLEEEKFIFVHQDERGRFMSSGGMDMMTPHLSEKPDSTYTDNSSDTYDAVEWLLHHTNNNGKVGLWGISYRGFYASSGIIDAHPAITCSSPQAPISNWYTGDDIHHNGAFTLLPNFNFFELIGRKHDTLYQEWPSLFDYPVRDAYNLFLNIGKLRDVNANYFNNEAPYWEWLMEHPDYDDFWQARNILPHLKNIKPAVLVTGGFYDHENLYGSLQTYSAIERNSENDTRLTLGPWFHGGWARSTGEEFGILKFGQSTSAYYQENIETPFFNHYLKRKGSLDQLARVNVFITGTNLWDSYNIWPPPSSTPHVLYLHSKNALSAKSPEKSGFIYTEYLSDPQHPVPYTQEFHSSRVFYNKEYMVEDQRFASSRPDVLTYTTEVLEDTLTAMGKLSASIFSSSNTSDYDLIVKLIDVYPDTIDPNFHSKPLPEKAGFQQLVRAEIFRIKYRNSFSIPEACIPGKIEKINIPLNDIGHAFLPGHRIMVQIQSSWFPLYDRNPQQFMNCYEAEENDYLKANIRIYHSSDYPSSISIGVLESE